MAEKQTKRHREEVQATTIQDSPIQKRQNSCTQEEEQVLYEDIFDPFQVPDPELAPMQNTETVEPATEDCSPSCMLTKEEEDDEKERMIRHLLEASDDELGLPDKSSGLGEDFIGPVDLFDDPFSCCDGIWELEDEVANYSTLLQAELFM
ncbi:hypothetical protein ACET3Z_029407 [Daucus carota]